MKTYLEEIKISNMALINDLSIELEQGLNVITGPTGSGKTMLIEAMKLTLGERADYDLLPEEGELNARISFHGTTDITGLPIEDEKKNVMFERKLTQDHRSKASVNKERIRLKSLREHRKKLIDFHGQHENQAVFEESFARRVLDRFGDYDDLLEEYRTLYEDYSQLEDELKSLQGDQTELDQRLELLNYQLSEFEDFEPDKNEWEEIEELRLQLESREEIQRTVNESRELLEGNHSLTDQLERLIENLKSLTDFDSSINDWSEEVKSASVMLEELRRELNDMEERVSGSDLEYDDLMDRRSRWLELARKHEVPPEKLFDKYMQLRDEQNSLENRDQRKNELTERLEQLEHELYELAEKIHSCRNNEAEKLEESVIETLEELNLEKADFRIQVKEDQLGPSGFDVVKWLFASHESEPVGPLASRVSGGEISRVLLAIKSSLAEADQTPVLVFDEIDAGISGEEASRVGEVLSDLADYHQVICITHLPLVASKADHHILVERTDEDDDVKVDALYLDNESRIDEISRLLSGDNESDISREQARELLET